MIVTDIIKFHHHQLVRHRWRTTMISLCIAIGVSAVVLLVSLGESARQYVQREFAALGSNMLIVLPGKKHTQGGGIPFYGTATRDLTIQDAEAIRHLPGIVRVAPIIAGTATLSVQGLSKDIMVVGSTHEFLAVRGQELAMGQNLSKNHSHRNDVILGHQLAQDLLDNHTQLGQKVTLDGYRFRVVGILNYRGESLGLDMRNVAIIPVSAAEALFDSPALFRVLVETRHRFEDKAIIQHIYELIRQRHQGSEDITIVTQASILDAFNRIMLTLTAVIGLLASVSLLVAGFLVMNLSLINVAQRRSEIGLLKAMGASRRTVLVLFVSESLLLAAMGSALGLLVTFMALLLLNQLQSYLLVTIPVWAALAATLLALCIAGAFSWFPARQAADVSPVEALRG
ncbi:Macrolide export ATP-binding/permease protein MacB [Saliniradius amylolyticus]|uniref:Macrolide export ATP-binding/permease protein MacB n=1 Tax=Saliniradius amylolyticus TaxID=2183582 RepID=A0A2S2E489_9ALTE|nr:ABC transporter permease [Saliniradius amylolyticus]AWL12468.1 Macrolide export ATP-binding/permease protein MacB [Saliniradius amylolyticus]